MAFTYCTNCGEKIDMENRRCPYCGHAREGYSYGAETHIGQNRMENADRGSERYGDNGAERESTDFGPEGYGRSGQDGYGSWDGDQNGYGGEERGFNNRRDGQRPLYRIPGSMPPKRPISVGLTIFSIINILFSCCAFPSLIFGILALVNTVQAQSAKSEEEETAKKKIALVLNVVGAALTIITIVSFTVVFTEALAQYVANGNL